MRKFLLVFVAVILVGIYFYTRDLHRNLLSAVLSSDTSDAAMLPSPSPTPVSKVLIDIKQAVSEELDGEKGSYALYYKNLKNNDMYALNEHRQFTSGSLYKLWVMASTYEKIRLGDVSEDEQLSRTISYLNQQNDIDPSDAELTSGDISLTVKTALYQMITISHNYAAMLLTDRLGRNALIDFARKENFKETTFGPPSTTAFDVGLFFDRLYTGTLVDKGYSSQMLELLSNQKKDNKIPRLLPENATVANKTGELGNFSHDSSIVYTENGDYILVVLSETPLPGHAEAVIAGISKRIFDTVTSKAH
jgi:beta-lactamase class A